MADLSNLSDEDVRRRTERAWVEAARCWQEYRSSGGPRDLRSMLKADAETAQDLWAALRAEQERRNPPQIHRPAVLSVPMAHDWAPINASCQQCLQCEAIRPLPDECVDCETVADCYARGHGGGDCPAGFDVE
jgi:hypothetical protein